MTDIRKNWEELQPGFCLVASDQGLLGWSFERIDNRYREPDDPPRGLVLAFEGVSTLLDLQPVPQELTNVLQKVFRHCELKFQRHSSSRRIVLFEPLGRLEHRWWREMFGKSQPLECVDEVWIGEFELIDEKNRGWQFERVFSR